VTPPTRRLSDVLAADEQVSELVDWPAMSRATENPNPRLPIRFRLELAKAFPGYNSFFGTDHCVLYRRGPIQRRTRFASASSWPRHFQAITAFSAQIIVYCIDAAPFNVGSFVYCIDAAPFSVRVGGAERPRDMEIRPRVRLRSPVPKGPRLFPRGRVYTLHTDVEGGRSDGRSAFSMSLPIILSVELAETFPGL
jgi:hypothetical protein